MGVADGGEDGAVSEVLLYFEQINARFNQVGSIAVAQAVRGNLFFMPPASSGVVADCAPFIPPARLGNNSVKKKMR